jgi:hypothetical protein
MEWMTWVGGLVAPIVAGFFIFRATFLWGERGGFEQGQKDVRHNILSEALPLGYCGVLAGPQKIGQYIDNLRREAACFQHTSIQDCQRLKEVEKQNVALHIKIGNLEERLVSKEMVAIESYEQKIAQLKNELSAAECLTDDWKNRALRFEANEAMTLKQKRRK